MTEIDPRLDRLVEFDSRSFGHPVTALLPREALKPRSYSWCCNTWLDQGREGACAGFAWSHELAARPAEIEDITNESAFKVYTEARKLDKWPGENYSGTSVLAGIKAVQKLYPHAIQSYKWAFSVEEVIATLGYFGPVVLGINWYEKMYAPDEDGWIKVGGQRVGGHAILACGVNIRGRFVTLHNSWGKSWGKEGKCRLSLDDLHTLLKLEGEACVPVGRFVT